MPRVDHVPRFAAAIMLLTKAPRTAAEISGLLSATHGTVLRWLRILEAEGLVQQAAPRQNPAGRSSPVWEWIA